MMMRHASKGCQWPMAIISHALTLDGLSHVCIHGCMHARINGEKYIYIYIYIPDLASLAVALIFHSLLATGLLL